MGADTLPFPFSVAGQVHERVREGLVVHVHIVGDPEPTLWIPCRFSVTTKNRLKVHAAPVRTRLALLRVAHPLLRVRFTLSAPLQEALGARGSSVVFAITVVWNDGKQVDVDSCSTSMADLPLPHACVFSACRTGP